MQKGDNIAERVLLFAAGVVRVVSGARVHATNRHVITQTINAATSVGANYAEARAAESRTDFIHKVGVSVKELREAVYWLQLLSTTGIVTSDVAPLVREANELIAILVASRKTAANNREASG